MKNIFQKTISQLELDYGLFTNLPRIIVAYEFIQTQKKYPTSLDKIRILTWKLLIIQAKTFLVN